jgi:hypothetical protein
MSGFYVLLPPDGGSGGSAYWGDAVVNFAALPASAVTGEVRITLDTGNAYRYDGTSWVLAFASGADVVGPASSTDNAVVRFDSTTGKLLQNSVVIIGDTGNVTGVANLTVTGTTTLAAALSGVIKASSGVISTGNVSLTSEVSGVLPIANGGTNSNTALSNSRVIHSVGGALVESTVTSTELGYLSGVTSAIQTQINSRVADEMALSIAGSSTWK